MDQRSCLSGEVRIACLQGRDKRSNLRNESLSLLLFFSLFSFFVFIWLRSNSACSSTTPSIDTTPTVHEIHWTIDDTSNSFRYANEKLSVATTTAAAPASVIRISGCSPSFHFSRYAGLSVCAGRLK